ncbi:bifunctional GNAT family N-acetyltransferase/acetate--CoA ligase family protein [Rhodococcus sp. X156]|uniref:bifunctional acetate--CoA ligase family protein/GNAT family N-acetyltransferase n=1 Tax=Rhodococcus sp. X156 TaxID=2499145 RepID=UPI000FD71DA1|nr:bifunctional GNAT family N-acetyltransferase/acetate--CoA ligase family protein [Rhodococcus sp. X156]
MSTMDDKVEVAEEIDPYHYPKHWEGDALASDGGTVHLRPMTPDLADDLVRFHSQLSERTRYLRYFGPYPTMSARDLARFSTVDHHDRVAFVVLLGGEIIAVGRYERLTNVGDGHSAEVAFVVADAHQGRGLGSVLLEHLAAAAAECGIRTFVAEVLSENRSMLGVFKQAGYQIKRSFDGGVLHLEFAVDPSEALLTVRNFRERASEARSVHNVLHPSSVAVIGASTDRFKVGHAVLVNLLRAGFTGPVYPVNAENRSVQGIRAYAAVSDIPDPVDLAVVAVPASGVEAVLDDCLAKGVKALVVISAGFSEAGPEGLAAERRMVEAARAHGMRVVGPSALGVANTDPEVALNATLAPVLPPAGRVGFFCQSGALGIAILAAAAERGLGLSTFVSAGNRADISGNDLLQYWDSDPATDVVLLYLESFGNPRKFSRLARRLARNKPVIVVKSGRHAVPAGLAATSVEVDEASVQALFEEAGVIRVESIAQLFDCALLLAYQPLPAGPRVAVVGNSTALGVLGADAARSRGLTVVGDPVDVGASATPQEFAKAVGDALAADDVDALIAVFVPPVAIPGTEFATALRETLAGSRKPVVTTFLAAEGIPDSLAVLGADGQPARGSVPSYPGPERAALALSRAVRYAQWRERPGPDPEPLAHPELVDVARARELVQGWLADAPEGRWLTDDEAAALLDTYGVEVAAFRVAHDADQAVAAAHELGFPVAVKAMGEQWRDRSDLIGVRLDVSSDDAVRIAYDDLREVSGNSSVYVQQMAGKGINCTVAVQDDPSFGSLISFGLSGVISDLLGDRAYRVLPLTSPEELIRAPKAAPLLTGYRGSEPADLDSLALVVGQVAALAEHVSQIRELSCGPILASPDGASVTAARVRIGPEPTRADLGPRRLR